LGGTKAIVFVCEEHEMATATAAAVVENRMIILLLALSKYYGDVLNRVVPTQSYGCIDEFQPRK
jgi:hypothetical protein